jgi:hypothetical protein
VVERKGKKLIAAIQNPYPHNRKRYQHPGVV